MFIYSFLLNMGQFCYEGGLKICVFYRKGLVLFQYSVLKLVRILDEKVYFNFLEIFISFRGEGYF